MKTDLLNKDYVITNVIEFGSYEGKYKYKLQDNKTHYTLFMISPFKKFPSIVRLNDKIDKNDWENENFRNEILDDLKYTLVFLMSMVK